MIRIFGGGPAGLACAITLAKLGREVEVVDRRDIVGLQKGKSRSATDVQVSIIEPRLVTLLERFLGISFRPATTLRAVNCQRSYSFDASMFFLSKIGSSRDTLTAQLINTALQSGVRFSKGKADCVTIADPDELSIDATGSASSDSVRKIFGWRIPVCNWIPDGSAIIDFGPLTNDYTYFARLGDTTTCIFLSRKPVLLPMVLADLRERFPRAFPPSSDNLPTPLACPLPSELPTSWSHSCIGTRRGINDKLLFFGLADSIVDGMNHALYLALPKYRASQFCNLRYRKNLILRRINWLKELACTFRQKSRFVDTFCSHSSMHNWIIRVFRTTASNDLMRFLEEYVSSVQGEPLDKENA